MSTTILLFFNSCLQNPTIESLDRTCLEIGNWMVIAVMSYEEDFYA